MIEKVEIPEAKKGQWSISKFQVTKEDSMFHVFSAGSRYCPAGEYTKLTHEQRGVIMSDTPAEMRDHLTAVMNAQGSVLINGLGIGMVLNAVLKKESVTDVTVIELEQDVIDLVAHKYIGDPRVTIICASAYDYVPPKGKRYNMVWHDIWDNICEENLPEMAKLHRKYGRLSDWQGSWAKAECLRQRRESRSSPWRMW